MSPQIDSELKSAMKERLLGLIRKPQVEVKKKSVSNMAPLALLGFNGTMAFLDLISGLTVGFLTNWFYGVLTFLSGFLALFLHEKLFTNAHANMSQKWLAVGGGALAVVSTLGVGILAGIANVLQVTSVVSTSTIEIIMIISLVVISFLHGVVWGVYYFTDPSHVAEMKRIVNMAYRQQQLQGLADAKEDLAQVKAISAELEDYESRGEADLINASYEQLRGHSLLNVPIQEKPIEANPNMPFLAKRATVNSATLSEDPNIG